MDSLIQQILAKFCILGKIINKIIQTFDTGKNLYERFDLLETSFMVEICDNNLLSMDIDVDMQNDYNTTKNILIEDYSDNLNSILADVLVILEQQGLIVEAQGLYIKKIGCKKKIIPDLQYLFNIFPKEISKPQQFSQNINYNNCQLCGNSMTLDTTKSELRCEICGLVKELLGTVFEDTVFYNQDGQKTKSGTFNPNRHFQSWWIHILAKEPEEELGDKKDPQNQYGEKTLSQIREIIKRDNKILQLLTVKDIRIILRELSKTHLNKNIPLILKKITGIGPPNIPEHIAQKVEYLFTKAIEVSEKIKNYKRINRNYYPYYIYRIVEAITNENDNELRRVLFYIYIQSKDTVESDDLEWEKICKEIDEIPYKPTNRTLGDKYKSSDYISFY